MRLRDAAMQKKRHTPSCVLLDRSLQAIHLIPFSALKSDKNKTSYTVVSAWSLRFRLHLLARILSVSSCFWLTLLCSIFSFAGSAIYTKANRFKILSRLSQRMTFEAPWPSPKTRQTDIRKHFPIPKQSHMQWRLQYHIEVLSQLQRSFMGLLSWSVRFLNLGPFANTCLWSWVVMPGLTSSPSRSNFFFGKIKIKRSLVLSKAAVAVLREKYLLTGLFTQDKDKWSCISPPMKILWAEPNVLPHFLGTWVYGNLSKDGCSIFAQHMFDEHESLSRAEKLVWYDRRSNTCNCVEVAGWDSVGAPSVDPASKFQVH